MLMPATTILNENSVFLGRPLSLLVDFFFLTAASIFTVFGAFELLHHFTDYDAIRVHPFTEAPQRLDRHVVELNGFAVGRCFAEPD